MLGSTVFLFGLVLSFPSFSVPLQCVCLAEGMVRLSVVANKAHLELILCHQPLHETLSSSPVSCDCSTRVVVILWLTYPVLQCLAEYKYF